MLPAAYEADAGVDVNLEVIIASVRMPKAVKIRRDLFASSYAYASPACV